MLYVIAELLSTSYKRDGRIFQMEENHKIKYNFQK